ncbi:hypothetical protein EG329_006678 [Mollisiaceae sp. DMI_Dod_QoI]|nr:hypothetical protein EG329_006678 [Helotiales sp. DMI_Dod_QoI]
MEGERNDIAMADSGHAQASAAPSASSSIATAWLDGTMTSAEAITDPHHPFFVNSTNAAGFKYKYPEAEPTPDGEDDVVWNRTFTAADSRMYNKNGKDANQSRKFRLSGETYNLTLTIHLENKKKHAKKWGSAFAIGDGSALKAGPKPKTVIKASEFASKESSADLRDPVANLGVLPLSISEMIKSEGRSRKTSSITAPSKQESPGPSNPHTMVSSALKMGSPAPPKIEKPAPKKKGTAAPVKKGAPKKPKPDASKSSNISAGTQGPLTKPPTASDSESNDGGEYCICRGPDDHRMMVFCEGGCEDWYHCSCVGVNEEDAKELLDRFICPKCKNEKLFTTWKRMCRYYNVDKTHRKAARVNENSKYCSDECGNKFFEYVFSKVRVDDAPSLGGELNQKEAATLLHSVKNAAEFHALGKKPQLPVEEDHDPNRPIGLDYVTPEEQHELDNLKRRKAVIEGQLLGYKNQVTLLGMIHDRAKIAAKHPSVDVKDMCGYDNRLAMNDAEFEKWMKSEEAKEAFKTGKLGPRTAETKGIAQVLPYPGQAAPATSDVPDALNNICIKSKKKCKHIQWREVHNQDFCNMIQVLEAELEKLKEKEDEIIDDAETREATKEYYANNITIQLF